MSPPIAVVFDMDECTGTWAYGGIFYSLLRYLGKEDDPGARKIYLKYIYPYVVRPGFRRCLRLLQRYKMKGKVQDVVCYTANTGVGYPEFIRDCYEMDAGTPGLFTAVFVTHRGEANSYGEKDLSELKRLHPEYVPPYRNVLAFDDRTEAWTTRNGSRKRVVRVSPYGGDPRLPLPSIVETLSRRYELTGNIPLARRQGELTFFTRHPRRYSSRYLFDILSDFEQVGETFPNTADEEVRTRMIPSIRKFIHHCHGRPRVHVKRRHKHGFTQEFTVPF